MTPTIIFLDIDGVLCTLRSHFAFGDKGGLMSAWDITVCQMIRRLCKNNNCKIVISSTWRTSRFNILDYYLAMYGLIEHVYNYPDQVTGAQRLELDSHWKTPRLSHVDGQTRGLEIESWMKSHPEFKNYLIIDDDSDMLEYQKPFFIKTDSMEGFSSQNYIDCEELLKGFKNEKD